MIEIIDFINRLSLPFVFGFIFSTAVVSVSLIYLFLYESINPIKKIINSFLVILSYIALLFSLVLEYNYVLIINQFTTFLLDPKHTIYYITYLNLFFYIIHYKVISENLVKNKTYQKIGFFVNYGVLLVVLLSTTLNDYEYYFIFVVLFLITLFINFFFWLKCFKSKSFAVMTFIITLFSFVFFMFKTGYLFGLTFNSFQMLYFLNAYKWVIFTIYPILLGIGISYYNFLIVKSYDIDKNNNNKLNSFKFIKVKPEEKKV
jgi:hypothetical protein